MVNYDAIKAKKRSFLIVFLLALIPPVSLAGYRLYGIVMELMTTIRDGIILALIVFVFHIFVGAILLVVLSVPWLGVCCYLPLKRLHDDYSQHVFPQAVMRNPDYDYVKLLDAPRLLDAAELVDAKVLDPDSIQHPKSQEHLMGRYKKIEFEIASLALSHGRDQEIRGTVTVFTGLKALFHENDYVQVSCSAERDVFAAYLPAKRGWEVKKRIDTNDYRTVLITAPENQVVSEAQLALLARLMGEISQQTLTSFYITFSQGRVYFIDDGSSLIVKLPLWRGVEKEIQDVERNGIANINLFINTLLRVAENESSNRYIQEKEDER